MSSAAIKPPSDQQPQQEKEQHAAVDGAAEENPDVNGAAPPSLPPRISRPTSPAAAEQEPNVAGSLGPPPLITADEADVRFKEEVMVAQLQRMAAESPPLPLPHDSKDSAPTDT